MPDAGFNDIDIADAVYGVHARTEDGNFVVYAGCSSSISQADKSTTVLGRSGIGD